MGDSYVQGTGAGTGRDHVAPLASAILGFDHWHDGVGGTGWNSSDANEPAARVLARIAAMSRTPDIVVSALGYNDVGGNLVSLSERYRAWAAAVHAALPDRPIVTFGPWTPLGNGSSLDALRTVLHDEAQRAGAHFIDIADWVTVANRGRFIGGDNVHPNRAGHVYLARRAAQAIAASPASD
jgi:lysophospholipase L1-like esterase